MVSKHERSMKDKITRTSVPSRSGSPPICAVQHVVLICRGYYICCTLLGACSVTKSDIYWLRWIQVKLNVFFPPVNGEARGGNGSTSCFIAKGIDDRRSVGSQTM